MMWYATITGDEPLFFTRNITAWNSLETFLVAIVLLGAFHRLRCSATAPLAAGGAAAV